jgi:hypothetical protein
VLGRQEGVRERKEGKVHKEKTEQKLAAEVELGGRVSPEEEEESSISSTSKPVTDIKVRGTLLEHITSEDQFNAPDFMGFPSINVQLKRLQVNYLSPEFPRIKIFLRYGFKSTAPLRNIKWGFHCGESGSCYSTGAGIA